MTFLLAAAYVGSAVLLVAGVASRVDPRVAEALGGIGAGLGGARRGALERLGGLIRSKAAREFVARRLKEAGSSSDGVDRVLGSQVALAAAACILGITAVPGAGLGVLLPSAVLAMAAFRWPVFALARRGAQRRFAASAAVPDLLDLVAVCVTAGLTPRLALDRASEWVPGPLAEQLVVARRHVALGMPWRRALRDVAERSGTRDLRRLSVALERSERLGSPVARELRALAGQVRAERRAAGEERARRAPVTMLFPLVFLILPAFVLAAVVPALLVATRGLE